MRKLLLAGAVFLAALTPKISHALEEGEGGAKLCKMTTCPNGGNPVACILCGGGTSTSCEHHGNCN